MDEYYRQFAFVSSVLAGFAFTFYAALLAMNRESRAASVASLLTVTASVCFLIVTLATTFSAAYMARLPPGSELPPALAAQLSPISIAFSFGILLMLASFGLGGWIRSRRVGFATTAVAVVGVIGVCFALWPFVRRTSE